MAQKRKKVVLRQNGFPAKKMPMRQQHRRPFWLPATSYYFLTVSIAIILFLFVWGILGEGGDDMPWIPAGILSCVLLIGSVFLREVFLKQARDRYLIAQKQLDYNLSKLPASVRKKQKRRKFTLQQNSLMVNQILQKSDAARVLKRLTEGHLEVFEMCNEYLNFTGKELQRIDFNSPRFPAIRKSRKKIKKLHKFHLLKWAEIETKKYTRKAKNRASVERKVETAQKALSVLDSALRYYPKEENLRASASAVEEFISNVKISHQIELAEKSVFNGNIENAIRQYKDVLFFLSKENLSDEEKALIEERVKAEIHRLNELSEKDNLYDYQDKNLKKIEQ